MRLVTLSCCVVVGLTAVAEPSIAYSARAVTQILKWTGRAKAPNPALANPAPSTAAVKPATPLYRRSPMRGQGAADRAAGEATAELERKQAARDRKSLGYGTAAGAGASIPANAAYEYGRDKLKPPTPAASAQAVEALNQEVKGLRKDVGEMKKSIEGDANRGRYATKKKSSR